MLLLNTSLPAQLTVFVVRSRERFIIAGPCTKSRQTTHTQKTRNPQRLSDKGCFVLLGYSCFTLLCQSLLYNAVSQLYVYIYPLPLGTPSHLTPHSSWSPGSTELSSLSYAAGSPRVFKGNLWGEGYRVPDFLLIGQWQDNVVMFQESQSSIFWFQSNWGPVLEGVSFCTTQILCISLEEELRLCPGASQVALVVKNPLAMQKM